MSKELRLYAAILDQNVVLVASMAGCGEQKEERRREKGGGGAWRYCTCTEPKAGSAKLRAKVR